MPRLIATQGPLAGALYSFVDACLIGRDPSADVVLAEPTASRRHTEIRPRRDGGFVVRDLDSHNGTYLNGKRVKEGPLKDGDTLTVGDCSFLFHENAAAGSTIAGAPPRRFQLGTTIDDFELVGESPALGACLAAAGKLAAAEAPVLVTGETGAGKELVARWIHRESPRSRGPFVAVNCAAIPEALFESELFGAEQGAYTGATGRRAGKFELASGGTLFLDEIGELPLALQPKLLRAVQERAFYRVGGTQLVKSDVRILSATNRDLAKSVKNGMFREDLYHRLSTLPLRVPALRERPQDIPLLACHVAARAARRQGKAFPGFSTEALGRLSAYPWPGNVRELENVIERAVVLSEGAALGADALDIPASTPAADGEDLSLAAAEREAIRRALSRTGGRKGEAARLLGISWPTLRRKIKEHTLTVALLLLAAAGSAEEPPAADAPMRLTLTDAIERALRGNADLAVERLTPRIAAEGVEAAKGDFDPVLSASYEEQDAHTKTASSLGGAPLLQERTQTYGAGVEKKLETGTSVGVDVSHEKEKTNNRFSTLNPSFSTDVTLTVRQSLLKGFGTTVNRADVEIARSDAAAARQLLAARVASTIQEVENAYWDLAAAVENVGVQQSAYEAARALESANRARLDAGTLPRTEYLAAASAMASREADLMDAQRRSQDAQDLLRRLIGGAGEDPAARGSWNRPIVLVDAPTEADVAPDEAASIQKALDRRPEILQAREALEAERLRKIVASDNLKPDLSFEGSWTNERLEEGRWDALHGLEDDEARTWTAGLFLTFPLGNRTAESEYRQAEARIGQEAARIRSLREKVVVEVREALRALEWGKRRLAAQKRAVELSSENLRAEQVRYEQGLSTTQDVLKALADDTAERARFLTAQADHAKAVASWQRAQGTLAESKGVRVD